MHLPICSLHGSGRNLSYKKELFSGIKASRHKPYPQRGWIVYKTAATKTNTKFHWPDTYAEWTSKTWEAVERNKKTGIQQPQNFINRFIKFLLGSLFAVCFYPLFAAACCFMVGNFAGRIWPALLLQAITLYPAMKKLQEKDLYPWFLFLISGCFLLPGFCTVTG